MPNSPNTQLQSKQQPFGKFHPKLTSFVIALIMVSLFWLTGATGMLVDLLPVGEWLRWRDLVFVAATVPLTTGVFFVLLKLSMRPRPARSRRFRLAVAIGASVVGVIGIASTAVWMTVEENRKTQLLSGAHSLFENNLYHDGIAQNETDFAFIEMMTTFDRLPDQWTREWVDPPSVHFYKTLGALQESYPEGNLVSGYIICAGFHSTIVLALEQLNLLPALASSTAAHEAAHVALCNYLGSSLVINLPLWFIEGYAQSIATEGSSRWRERATRKIHLWELRSRIPSATTFCGDEVFQTNPIDGHVLSWFFLEYLTDKHGRSLGELLVESVKSGDQFEAALHRLAGNCETEFQSWAQKLPL